MNDTLTIWYRNGRSITIGLSRYDEYEVIGNQIDLKRRGSVVTHTIGGNSHAMRAEIRDDTHSLVAQIPGKPIDPTIEPADNPFDDLRDPPGDQIDPPPPPPKTKRKKARKTSGKKAGGKKE